MTGSRVQAHCVPPLGAALHSVALSGGVWPDSTPQSELMSLWEVEAALCKGHRWGREVSGSWCGKVTGQGDRASLCLCTAFGVSSGQNVTFCECQQIQAVDRILQLSAVMNCGERLAAFVHYLQGEPRTDLGGDVIVAN